MMGSTVWTLMCSTARRYSSSLRTFSSTQTAPARNARPPLPKLESERVVTTSDGAVIVCWHPEKKFPYEFTRPVPRAEATADTNQK